MCFHGFLSRQCLWFPIIEIRERKQVQECRLRISRAYPADIFWDRLWPSPENSRGSPLQVGSHNHSKCFEFDTFPCFGLSCGGCGWPQNHWKCIEFYTCSWFVLRSGGRGWPQNHRKFVELYIHVHGLDCALGSAGCPRIIGNCQAFFIFMVWVVLWGARVAQKSLKIC